MKQSPTNICPLRALGPGSAPAVCIEERCAWFHIEYHRDGGYADGMCALVRIADALCLSQESQTSGDLGKKEAAQGAANTQSGEETPHVP